MHALMILLTVAPMQLPAVSDDLGPAARPAWLLEAGIGAQSPVTDAAAWLDEAGKPTGTLRLQYSLGRFLPGLYAHAGASIWNRASVGAGTASLSFTVSELELGASWQWPRDGFWNVAFPYVRVAALLGYWRVRTGRLGDDLWAKPGVRGVLGMRLHLGQMAARRGPASARLYLFGEGGFAARLSGRPRLELLNDEDETLLSGEATRLGSMNLSGWTWSVGIGFAF